MPLAARCAEAMTNAVRQREARERHAAHEDPAGKELRGADRAPPRALADCHRECFQELVSLELKDLTEQLDLYMRGTGSAPHDFLRAWKDLEPYRVAVPAGTDSLMAQFLFSNLKIALAILEHQTLRVPEPAPVA